VFVSAATGPLEMRGRVIGCPLSSGSLIDDEEAIMYHDHDAEASF
jgi:hypothetical protein